jgi:hypothetical chaperone protein
MVGAMRRHIGIDFGTTNTAVAWVNDRRGDSGGAELLSIGGSPTCRTVLYFEPDGELYAGAAAIDRYLEREGEGRLVQSIKSHLASKTFRRTRIGNRAWTLEELVAAFLRSLRGASDIDLGRRAVIGRPVRYWGATDNPDDARAVARMTEAARLAGFDEVTFVYEPVAAAREYAHRVDSRQRVLIADFGGGTSDFSILEIEPGAPPRVLANAGVAVGGDSFDARVIDFAVAPMVGKSSSYRDAFGAETPVPAWLFSRLRRWHLLSFLKEKKTMALLERIARGADDPTPIERLIAIVSEDLGLALHQSVERLKISLGEREVDLLRFERSTVALARQISRASFDGWIAAELARCAETIDEALARAEIDAAAIECVFATGGSSLVVAISRLLRDKLKSARLVGAAELTSVASGLALCARDLQ